VLHPRVFKADLKRFLPGYERHHTPEGDYLIDLLRPLMEESLPSKYRYEESFDRIEYLIALAYADLYEKYRQDNDFIGPIGRFAWRQRNRTNDILQVVADELSKFGEN
jgi:hypothetical protein